MRVVDTRTRMPHGSPVRQGFLSDMERPGYQRDIQKWSLKASDLLSPPSPKLLEMVRLQAIRVAGRWLRRFGGQAWRDEAERQGTGASNQGRLLRRR